MINNVKFWKGKNITAMTGNNIFVYGANPEFRNGFGAAKQARAFGAKPFGGGRGLVGNTFGLITKNLKVGFVEKATGIVYEANGYRSVPPEMIRTNISELYKCALDNPEKIFFIAYKNEVKRNLNGYSNKELWILFTSNFNIPLNIRFHESFRILNTSKFSHASFNYEQEIKKNNQPRSNFTFFWHAPSPFSQWHPSVFKVKNVTFISCEQFMMYYKAKLFKDDYIAQEILNINTSENIFYDKDNIETHREDSIVKKYLAGELTNLDILNDKKANKEWNLFQKKIKALGRKVKNYDESTWIKRRIACVFKGNFEKFMQNKELRKELTNTGNTIMVESNPFDGIWGNKLNESDFNATNPSKWKGLNLLGKILTELREKIKQG